MTDQRDGPYARVAAEFPDYDLMTLPAIPPSWVDVSWRNDACPTFDTGTGLRVMTDYADQGMREFDSVPRFMVTRDSDGDQVFASDDWDQVLVFVTSYLQAQR